MHLQNFLSVSKIVYLISSETQRWVVINLGE